MEIQVKDLLNDDATRACLCECIAEKLVENHFFEEVEKVDFNGCVVGYDKALKEDVENTLKNVALEVATKETLKLLEDDYAIKNKIRETIKNYIVEQFNSMVK